MASAELQRIERRIKSVQSTRKITRAMELIAASRILRAQARVQQAQPYNDKLVEVIRNAGRAATGSDHLLLQRREIQTIGFLVVSSDRGLAGAYNSNVIRDAEQAMIDSRAAGRDARVFVVGKKAQTYFRFRGYQITRAFLGVTDTPGYGDARAIANVMMEAFASGAVDAVNVHYTAFRSALTQEVRNMWLMPVDPLAEAEEPEGKEEEGTEPSSVAYEFEPDPEILLARLLPRYVEASVFGILLTSSAAEHAARQRAMKAATENADELVQVLTRFRNQARQAEITTEISEIVGAAEALARQ